MGINKKEQEALEQKAKRTKNITIVAIVISIIVLIVISIVLNNSNNSNNSSNSSNGNNTNIDKYNLTASEKKLEKEILEADKPVLVDYYADWCQPCRMMAPVLEELKNEQEDFYIMKVDIEKYSNLGDKAGARSIPYFVLYNNGEFVASTLGFQSKESLINFVNNNIQK